MRLSFRALKLSRDKTKTFKTTAMFSGSSLNCKINLSVVDCKGSEVMRSEMRMRQVSAPNLNLRESGYREREKKIVNTLF